MRIQFIFMNKFENDCIYNYNKNMKKIISIIFSFLFISITVFAGKPIAKKEPSPLSVLSTNTQKQSWCEKEGYANVPGSGTLHYWLYDSYKYHDGDISDFVLTIIPKWFQSLNYFVVSEYSTVSPNNSLADSVKKLMKDNNCDMSVTITKGSNSFDNVYINSFDKETNIYTTYIYSGTKVDR